VGTMRVGEVAVGRLLRRDSSSSPLAKAIAEMIVFDASALVGASPGICLA
jgi:hypothetical protein